MSAPFRTLRRRAEVAASLAGLLLEVGCVPSQRLTFVGDSITAAGPWQAAYPHRVVSNQGVPGDRASDVLTRLEQVKATRADLYLVMVGINDIRSGVPVEQVAAQIGEIRQRLLQGAFPLPRVVVLSTLRCRPTPMNGCTEAVQEAVAELNRRLAAQAPRGAFLDLNPGMAPDGLLAKAYTEDGIHLTVAGYRRWQELLAPLVIGLGMEGHAPTPDSR